jgi:hypothetical protein
MSEPIRTLRLKNGLLLRFYDESNRYFGDFHRVCIKLLAEIPVGQLTIPADLLAAAVDLPDALRLERKLERMGVVTADLVKVRQALLDDFLNSVVGYLEQPGFPERWLRKTLTEKPKRYKPSPPWD